MNGTARIGTAWFSRVVGIAALATGACVGGDSDGTAFTARMVGDEAVVDAANPNLHYWTCMDEPSLQKQVDGEWVGLRDDRPPGWNSPGYFLDDQYIAPSHNLGCDFLLCTPFGETRSVGRAIEHVKVGMRAKPLDAPPEAPSPVDVIETRPIAGELRVRVTFSTGSDCATSHEAFVPLTLPEQGVCCAVGSPECSSEGPGGGWARTLQECRPWSTEFDLAYQLVDDAHECPTLVPDYPQCCGCVPNDMDAGI